MTELPVTPGSVLAGRYRIDRVLGAGTMGLVAAAFHLEIEQAVAIKFVNPAALGEGEATERFRREARALAKINSEHVVRVLDVSTLASGLPYMVMELLEGRTLEEELGARRVLPVFEAVEYVLQAIEGVAAAHAAGIVHRDLKPANLFVARRADRSRLVKVLDFGVSRSLAESGPSLRLTRTGTIVGSPLYMSPEQLRGSKTPDARSDQWALGAILFELLSGRTPFGADSLPDLYAKLLRDEPNPISGDGVEVPRELEAIIARCLRQDPAERFADVSELARALLPFAPARAHVHAARARGVLFPGAPQGEEAPSTQSDEKKAPADGPSANTVSSWNVQVWTEPRRAIFLGLAATLLVSLVSFAILKLRLDATEPARGKPVTHLAAASGFHSATPRASSELAPASLPTAPAETPTKAGEKAEPAAKQPPSRLARAVRALPVAARLPALGRNPPPPAASSAAFEETLPNFGGRK